MSLADIIKRGWETFAVRDFDTLVSDYVDNMVLAMPGQADVLEGRMAFRAALDSLETILPPGFEITGLRQIEGKNEVVSIIEWKSEKIFSSQLCVLFKFTGDKIYEERWFIDTEQWNRAF